ncbi:hypothetical protein LOK49_LG04G03331 [Camellia lanceoleosa]|uniref:Uncharacterized protein n=1 Tax=Camellia lanceoleosa TaxID=1840588 RepID=A0ACC0I6E3_9ERIC|nr:hypothetical protein LOK49_LG04G03331 [Camellia lanceoleosa]
MAGLLAWAADVVGGGSNDEEDDSSSIPIPLLFTPQQQHYSIELGLKSASLSRSIQDLRLTLPSPHISLRLPHLHAHSLASNAALALQFDSHSSTRQQAQLRETTLQEENIAFEKVISNCEDKIQERLQEAELLWAELKKTDLAEKNLKTELENALAALDARKSRKSGELLIDSKTAALAQEDTKASEYALLDKLENKKKELCSTEEMIQELEKKWAQVQENALKQLSSAQREKILDRQLHSLIEQLAAKQAQAEGLVSEIHLKDVELEKLNGLWRGLEVNTARNRFGTSNSEKGSLSSDYIVDPHQRPSYHISGRTENQQRLMLLRSAFMLYILALHILVFIKLSF